MTLISEASIEIKALISEALISEALISEALMVLKRQP